MRGADGFTGISGRDGLVRQRQDAEGPQRVPAALGVGGCYRRATR